MAKSSKKPVQKKLSYKDLSPRFKMLIDLNGGIDKSFLLEEGWMYAQIDSSGSNKLGGKVGAAHNAGFVWSRYSYAAEYSGCNDGKLFENDICARFPIKMKIVAIPVLEEEEEEDGSN